MVYGVNALYSRLLYLYPGFFFIPLLLPEGQLLALLTQWLNLSLLTLSLSILFAYGGMFSFGHAVYVGIGAYVVTYALLWWGIPIWLTPLLGGLAALLLALPLGYICSHKRGITFAMLTLGMSELVAMFANRNPSIFGGDSGLSIDIGYFYSQPGVMYYLVLSWVSIAMLLIYILLRQRFGLLLQGVRDNPDRMVFLGFHVVSIRLTAIIFSAFLAGIAGTLYLLQFEIVSPITFATERSTSIFIYAYLGFMLLPKSLLQSAFLGAFIWVLSQNLLTQITPYWGLYLGLFFIFLVLKHNTHKALPGTSK
jgi:branched-chain amino acid transport system permease protein